jgi:hypothetical protein
VKEWREKVVVDDSPKAMVARSAADIMSSPKNLLLGVGMGQFGSRAALISSDEYLTVRMPRELVGESKYFHRYIQPALDEHEVNGEGSAISQPFCSVLNMVVEFGLPMAALLLVAVALEFIRNIRLSRSTEAHTHAVGIFANVGLVFFVLCCFIENYVEFPQALLVPALLYVAARASTKTS